LIKMQHRRTITILVLGALAMTMSLGAVAYRSVFAATPTTTSAMITGSATLFTQNWLGGNGMNGGYNNEGLANALGITVDALNTAYQAAYSAALKQAVSDGLITQAQADQLTANGSAFPFGDRWNGWLTQNGIDFNSYLAQALGISVEALKSAYQTAYYANIDQQVTDGMLTQDQADLMKGEYALYNDSTFQTSMQSAFTSAVNAAVSSGVISQAQADQILSKGNNMFMPGMFNLGGRGGPHGRGGGMMPDISSLPSATP
jgi:ribosomal protein S20